ncbi:hypothetical protein, partial [Vibrio diabolicus]|uniref:hypothetical protein n=1 Tax=Vibrio diabolicus TaxID=50719 RepID=UPI00211B6C7A
PSLQIKLLSRLTGPALLLSQIFTGVRILTKAAELKVNASHTLPHGKRKKSMKTLSFKFF